MKHLLHSHLRENKIIYTMLDIKSLCNFTKLFLYYSFWNTCYIKAVQSKITRLLSFGVANFRHHFTPVRLHLKRRLRNGNAEYA